MDNLKKRSLNALLWDLGGSFGQQGISFIISVFLARLLLPEEFGLVGMAMVFIAIFQVFGDVGFASALIHNQDTTAKTYSSVFYLNIVMGLILAATAYFAAPLVGSFYDNPEVNIILQWLSLKFILSSFNIVQQTILRKQLDMKTLNIRLFLAQFVGGTVGIVLAFQGYGVYALVIQSLIADITTTLFLWTVTDWYPKLEFSLREIKKLTGYSTYIFFDQVLSKFFQQLDTLFIGKVFSAATLGYFSRANSLTNKVSKYSSDSIKKVFFPVLSSLQNNDQKYFNVYYKVVSVVSFMAFGLTGMLFLLGESIIILLYGEKWEPSVLIFQILILKSFTYPINIMINNAILAKGKSRENFWIGVFRKTFRLIPLVIGYYFGLNYFLIALVGVSYFLTSTNILFLRRFVGASAWLHFKEILEGGTLLAIVIIGYYFFGPFTHIENFGLAGLFVAIYFGYSYLRKNRGMIFLMENGRKLIQNNSIF